MEKDNRIRVIIGHYGSGKTEFAVNYALKLAETERNVALADLDVVNPYFRSREKERFLAEKGVKLLASYIKGDALDLPAVTGDILGPLQDPSCQIILDVGGNNMGARVLARFKEYFTPGAYDMFCVVNGNRPETNTPEGVIHHIGLIEQASGTRVTGLINNTHLLRETTIETILQGQELCQAVAQVLQLPIKYTSVLQSLVPTLPIKLAGSTDLPIELAGLTDLPIRLAGLIMPIQMLMREPWMM